MSIDIQSFISSIFINGSYSTTIRLKDLELELTTISHADANAGRNLLAKNINDRIILSQQQKKVLIAEILVANMVKKITYRGNVIYERMDIPLEKRINNILLQIRDETLFKLIYKICKKFKVSVDRIINEVNSSDFFKSTNL